MKKFKNLVIGGIETKVVNLILITVLLMVAAFAAVNIWQTHMLTDLTTSAGEQQKRDTAEQTTAIMDTVARTSMEQLTAREARITDEIFIGAKARITMLAGYFRDVLQDPEAAPGRWHYPTPADDGSLTAYMLTPEGVEPPPAEELPEMGDVMRSICDAFGADNIYVGLPSGVCLMVNKTAGNWFDAAGNRSGYDCRTRGWYQHAVQAGETVFHVNPDDANTHAFCVECAMPVYDAGGELMAVVAADIFRDTFQEVLTDHLDDHGYRIVVDQDGHVIYSPSEDIIQAYSVERQVNVYDSDNEAFTALTRAALEDAELKTHVELVNISGVPFYMAAARIDTAGWLLLAAYPRETVEIPAATLVESYDRIQQEAIGTYNEKTGHARTTGIILLAAVLILALAGAILLGKRIVKPLNTITRRISEINPQNPVFRMEKSFRTGDEIEVLATSFADISQKTMDYVDEVQRVTAEKERIGTELHMANQIQESMLPNIFPAFPERKEFDIYARMDPAREVGGDFYDYFLIDDDHLCIVMADVSGKGVPAALFMMASKIILQSNAKQSRSAAEILARTNDAICANNKMEMFVTVWLGILEISTGKVTAASAGHEYPFVSHGGVYSLFRDPHGFVIGGMGNVRYKEYTLQLEPGDRLFLYTDGVAEATDANENAFGPDRILAALNRTADTDPKGTLDTVRAAVDDFVGEAEQFDDLTMLCFEYKGQAGQSAS